MMSTPAQARALVSYAKFPPAVGSSLVGDSLPGVRGAGSPFAPAAWNMGMGDYLKKANKNVFIAVQIETVEGLENCEEIAKVEGIGKSLFLCLRAVEIVTLVWWRWRLVVFDARRFADM